MRYSRDLKFDKIRLNLMIQSYYKYGPMRTNYTQGYLDAIGGINLRFNKFKETLNTEFLADIANYAMIAYMYPKSEYKLRTTVDYNDMTIDADARTVFEDVKDTEILKIAKSEYSVTFDKLRIKLLRDTNYDNTDIILGIYKYIKKLNTEYDNVYLAHIANMAMIGFVEPKENWIFRYTTSSESPGNVGISINEIKEIKDDKYDY
ncbi:MAG: hypothetical protein IJ593_02830 [Lachnospiraceae bacterium]|nr:hypothetical protein [Lachnospiraceae bacterium]